MTNKARIFLTLMFAFLLSNTALAEEGGEGGGGTQYVDLKPSFVANFGTAAKKLRFVKADVSVRVDSTADANAVEHHMPLIRNEIVLLLSEQNEETMGSMKGQEEIRKKALKRVRDVLDEEEGRSVVDDLLFTNFVIQR